jgi:hypothetical protein
MFLWIFLACSLVQVQDLAGQHADEGDEPLHGDFRFDYDFKMMKKLVEIDLSMSDVKKRLCSLEIATGNVPSAFSADQCGKETTECRCSNKGRKSLPIIQKASYAVLFKHDIAYFFKYRCPRETMYT